VGEARFISRVDAHQRYTIGEQVRLAVFMDKTHFFEPESERTVV